MVSIDKSEILVGISIELFYIQFGNFLGWKTTVIRYTIMLNMDASIDYERSRKREKCVALSTILSNVVIFLHVSKQLFHQCFVRELLFGHPNYEVIQAL